MVFLQGQFDDVQKAPTLPSKAPKEIKELVSTFVNIKIESLTLFWCFYDELTCFFVYLLSLFIYLFIFGLLYAG